MIKNINMEILEDFSASNDQTIVKGKRTKRPRSSSSASSSGGGAVSCGGAGDFYNNSMISSPTTSTCTEEDEDMANCLILLARGGSPPPPPPTATTRKFTEMPTTAAAGKPGIYVYECKTCNRSFPSFQALGGHRASHKKPKPTIDISDQKKSPPPPPPPPPQSDDQKEQNPERHVNNAIPPTHKSFPAAENKNKIHECSVCGSEFASGQALGGHMRRHRPVPATGNSNRIDADVNGSTSTSHDVGEKTGRGMLELDLNLPAPAEDDGKFGQFAASQQPLLVFSAAALVDCHY